VFDKQTKSTPLSLIIPSDQLFSLPLAETREAFEVRLSKEKLWERYNTLSQIAMLEGEERKVSGLAADVNGTVLMRCRIRIMLSWRFYLVQTWKWTRMATW